MGKHQPALLGGLFIGVLSSLPFVSSANACCCLWVVAGGILVVYLQQQATPEPVQTADAVIGGVLAGVIGAVIASIVTFFLFTSTAPLMQEQFRQSLENPDVPPEIRDFMTNLLTGRNVALFAFAVNIPLFAIFGMLGSLLGLAFFRKKLPPVVPQV